MTNQIPILISQNRERDEELIPLVQILRRSNLQTTTVLCNKILGGNLLSYKYVKNISVNNV